MEWWQYGLVAFAGLWAGVINSVAGSGTLVTFPALLAVGFAPVSATMTNAVGLSVGGLTGAYGYRRELEGQGRRIATLLPLSVVGAVVGAWLLLHLPASTFEVVVPVLVLLALLLVLVQPRLQRRLRERNARVEASAAAHDAEPAGERGRAGARAAVLAGTVALLVGVYGGYFTAAQGIMLVAGLGAVIVEDLQRLNALKNVLALAVNFVAAGVYLAVGGDRVVLHVSVVIAVASLVGGWLGARYGRRLPPALLRGIIVAVGLVAVVNLLANR